MSATAPPVPDDEPISRAPTPLAAILARRIARDGPMTLADYMAVCLGHSEYGYYRRNEPFGAAGDFITAPDISQMFGELIGLWCLEMWNRMGRPDPVLLVELGPGRATLLVDALRATRRARHWHAALRLHLVESSQSLRARQADALADGTPVWHSDVSTLPDGPMILLANEFFDALPVRQLVRRDDGGSGWSEMLVALDGAGRLVCAPAARESLLAGTLTERQRALPVGSIVEVPVAGSALVAHIAQRLTDPAGGGVALLVDYGYGEDERDGESSGAALGATLSAIRRHRHEPILARPGEADLSAHVDFSALARAAAAAGAQTWGPQSQGRFLNQLGIEERARQLAQAAPAQVAATIGAAARLTAAGQMGDLFKVLAIAGPGQAVPPGFDT
ncbi:MAG: SAM-dependent methyltransferase [Alphaproteobacteria bacterium]